MHLTDPSLGLWGSFAIVGAGIPIAVGLARAAQLQLRDQISITFFGDGAVNIGAFHEALNLATVWQAPVVFVCENNGLSTNTPLNARQAQTDISAKARAFGLMAEAAEAVDVFAVRQAAADLLEKVRATSEPAVLILSADRLCAHVGPVSTIPAINPQRMLEESGDPATRDPIVHCVGSILRDMPELRGDCIDILQEVPTRIAAEFARADAAFEHRNLTAGLVAPPPPKSHTV